MKLPLKPLLHLAIASPHIQYPQMERVIKLLDVDKRYTAQRRAWEVYKVRCAVCGAQVGNCSIRPVHITGACCKGTPVLNEYMLSRLAAVLHKDTPLLEIFDEVLEEYSHVKHKLSTSDARPECAQLQHRFDAPCVPAQDDVGESNSLW